MLVYNGLNLGFSLYNNRLTVWYDSDPALNAAVGIYVGQYEFKHKQCVYNSDRYTLSLTAGTEPIHYDYCRLR